MCTLQLRLSFRSWLVLMDQVDRLRFLCSLFPNQSESEISAETRFIPQLRGSVFGTSCITPVLAPCAQLELVWKSNTYGRAARATSTA